MRKLLVANLVVSILGFFALPFCLWTAVSAGNMQTLDLYHNLQIIGVVSVDEGTERRIFGGRFSDSWSSIPEYLISGFDKQLPWLGWALAITFALSVIINISALYTLSTISSLSESNSQEGHQQ
jgi:hypothetical protein